MDPTDITEKNIRSIYEREKRERAKASAANKAAGCIARFSGTVTFAIINAVFFAVWITVNMSSFTFDPYPFVLLTLVVSLESIFLSIIVLVSQNELSKTADARNQLDLQVNLLVEQETTAVAKLLIEVARKVGVEEEKWKDIEEMANDMEPEQVLEKIAEVEKNET